MDSERLGALTPSSDNDMRPRKTPTSSLSGSYASHSVLHYLIVTTVTATELLVSRTWYRTKARIWGIIWGGASPGTGTTIPSPAMRLPLEIVEMIIVCLIHDQTTLRLCSLVCYSWYIAAVPHLHHTLTTFTRFMGRFNWPHPIQKMHALGLLPLLKVVQIRCINEFSSKRFDRRTLRGFSALTNLQRLEIHQLDIPSFMPRVGKYFGSFSPTLQSLYLNTPKGSNREIIYFIGSFQRLEDLTLFFTPHGREPEEDLKLFPPFTPPLQGRLTVRRWTRASLFKDMVHLFGGMRFRALDLFHVNETRFLLRSCAKTLRVLKLHPTDDFGERLRPNNVRFQANDSIAMTHRADFDLSYNRSLQGLEVPADCIPSFGLENIQPAVDFLKCVLSTISTIKSPAFSRVDLIYQADDFHFLGNPWLTGHRLEKSMSQDTRFGLLRGAREAREFSPVLRVDIQGPFGDYVLRMLKEVVAAEKARGGFDDFFPEPLVTSDPLPL